jgi:hypothetical protein
MGGITINKLVDVDVDIDFGELVDDLSEKERGELCELLGLGVPFGSGTGDEATANRIIETAYLTAKRMTDVPREIADLFWVVHGRAL